MDVLVIILAIYIFVKPPQWLLKLSKGIEEAVEVIDTNKNNNNNDINNDINK